MSRSLYVQVIDDEEPIRDSIVTLLRKEGIAARGYASPRVFLDSYRPEETGCIVVDMWMPDMTGAEVQERLARIGDVPPIIVITGQGSIRMSVDAMKRGAVEFLEKPLDMAHLVELVRLSLKQRSSDVSEREKREDAQARVRVLTPREREVLEQLLHGRPNKIIARELGLSPRTVEIHRARVMEKTGAGSLPSLVKLAIAAGLDGKGKAAL